MHHFVPNGSSHKAIKHFFRNSFSITTCINLEHHKGRLNHHALHCLTPKGKDNKLLKTLA